MCDGTGLAGEGKMSDDIDRRVSEESGDSIGGDSVSRVTALSKGVIVSVDFASCL